MIFGTCKLHKAVSGALEATTSDADWCKKLFLRKVCNNDITLL